MEWTSGAEAQLRTLITIRPLRPRDHVTGPEESQRHSSIRSFIRPPRPHASAPAWPLGSSSGPGRRPSPPQPSSRVSEGPDVNAVTKCTDALVVRRHGLRRKRILREEEQGVSGKGTYLARRPHSASRKVGPFLNKGCDGWVLSVLRADQAHRNRPCHDKVTRRAATWKPKALFRPVRGCYFTQYRRLPDPRGHVPSPPWVPAAADSTEPRRRRILPSAYRERLTASPRHV